MRKQTKVVAVASAAALLAIGASMTSFAATGWVEEDGVWYYYDKDGNRVEDEWKKSGDNWYWLDSEEGGAMAIDKLIEDDDDTYYVDANGVMVKNTWVKVVNEDQDDDDDPAEYNYYYMQSNGKAYTAPDDGDTTFKTIDGKRYAFDEDGKMLYGWINDESERLTGDNDWNSNKDDEDIYYLGEWDDGSMKTGWQKITVCDDKDDDEEKDLWFWFKSNGKKYTAGRDSIKTDKKINGKKYGFDERGVMTYEWTLIDNATGSDATVSNWRYFRSPEDGARVTKGWFKVVAPSDSNDNVFDPEYEGDGFATTDADDETERWYYADEDGELYQGKIKKIKGKYYGFHPEGNNSDGDSKGGAMLSGLCLLEVSGEDIVYVWADGYKLVNTSGSITDNKTAGKDGADWYFYTYDEHIVMYTNNKTLKGDKDHTMNIDLDSWKDWAKKADTSYYDPAGLAGIEND